MGDDFQGKGALVWAAQAQRKCFPVEKYRAVFPHTVNGGKYSLADQVSGRHAYSVKSY